MANNTYNGWTNYATWRINLEIFDGFDPADWNDDWKTSSVADLADYMKDYTQDVVLEGEDVKTLADSYALAFLDEVNWHEIATLKMEEYT